LSTTTLRRLKIAGYRSIRSVDLELGPINVVIGPNGCGKTNLYNSLLLLASGAGTCPSSNSSIPSNAGAT